MLVFRLVLFMFIKLKNGLYFDYVNELSKDVNVGLPFSFVYVY